MRADPCDVFARVLGAVTLAVMLGACASAPEWLPGNVTLATHAAGSPLQTGSAAPSIVSAAFDSLDVARGSIWTGDFITSTNVASLEVRTNLFSINVPRQGFGRFRFSDSLIDVPPIFIRTYSVRIIARNTEGEEAEEDVPFRIR